MCESMEQSRREGELEKKERPRTLSRFRMKRTAKQSFLLPSLESGYI